MPNKIQRKLPQIENTFEPRETAENFNARLPVVKRRNSKVSFSYILTKTFNNCMSIKFYSWQLKLKTAQLILTVAIM